MKKLIIIEGAGKIAKIKSYLGSEYDVFATGGHFRQLKSDGLYNTGIASDYSATFEISPTGSKNWKKVKAAVANTNYEAIYIASDPDREGEGIAWHIYQSLPASAKKISKRITYNEITKDAIMKAINSPRQIDDNLVHAQFGRQAYDKLFGFRGSRFVQQNLNLKSIGRVQGVAVKFLGDRENEIANYQPHYQNEIKPVIIDDKENKVNLTHVDEKGNTKRYEKDVTPPNVENPFTCVEITTSNLSKESPTVPYITSTLLTEATRVLGVKVKDVQKALQTLYEKGYSSYPRTDSKSLSDSFFKELTNYLKKTQYANDVRDKKQFTRNAANSQEGHECLRITHPEIAPNDSRITALGSTCQKVYNMLYHRTMIQGLNDATYQNTTYLFDASKELFKTQSKQYQYLGWRVWPNYNVNNDVYFFTKDKKYNGKIELKEVNVNPKPSPYNEATLIKDLEKKGIGRPSTFATFPSILQDRNYAKLEGKVFKLTDEGRILYQVIENNFKDFINYEFTKEFEDDLDKIAEGKLNYQKYLKTKDQEIDKLVATKVQGIERPKKEVKISTDHFCDECQAYRIEKVASNGNKFYICSNFKYDPKTKKTAGCEIEWFNTPKKFIPKKKTVKRKK